MYCEQTLRRKADKIGYKVEKGFQHYRGFVFQPTGCNRCTGYMVWDQSTGLYVPGCYDENFDFQWDLEHVEMFLKKRYSKLKLNW